MKIAVLVTLLVTAASWAPPRHATTTLAPGRVRAPQQVVVREAHDDPKDSAPLMPAQLAVALPLLCTAAPVFAADEGTNPIVTAVQAVVVGGAMFTLGMMQPWRNDLS